MKRALLAGGALAAALALVAALWLLLSLDARVERTLERVGSELLGSEVAIGSVDVHLSAGRATVRDLEVANPRGPGYDFSSEPALRVAEISVTLDPASLAAEPIVLTDVGVRGSHVNLEVTEGGLNTLALNRLVARSRPAQADAAAGQEQPRRFLIRTLSFQQGTLHVDARAVGRGARDLELDDISVHELGAPFGDTPGELGKEVLGTFLNNVLAKAARERLSELVQRELDQINERLGEVIEEFFGLKPKKEED
jgi:hypothetical protein